MRLDDQNKMDQLLTALKEQELANSMKPICFQDVDIQFVSKSMDIKNKHLLIAELQAEVHHLETLLQLPFLIQLLAILSKLILLELFQ